MSFGRTIWLHHIRWSLTALTLLWPGLGKAQSLDYGSLEALFGEPVTTSATGSPQKVAQAPADMELITADQIRRFGATSLVDVLRHSVSIDVLRWGAVSADLSVRGYNEPIAPRLLVLINGRQVYLDDFGRTDWANLPVQLEEIRQIEIIKGPNTALYGFNAVGGVVNIITFNPLYDQVNAVTARVGTQSYREVAGVATAHIGDTAGVRLSVGGYETHDFSTAFPGSVNLGLGGSLEDRRPLKRSASLDSVVKITPEFEGRFEVTHSISANLEAVQADQIDDIRTQTSSIKSELTLDSGAGLISGSAYLNELDAASRFLFAKPWHNKVVVAKLQDLYKFGETNTVRVTAEYRYNTVNEFDFGAGEIFYSVYSGSAMWETHLRPDLVATNAIRLDEMRTGRSGPLLPGFPPNAAYGRDRIEPSFNSGLVWTASEVETVRLIASRGIQVPSLAELGFQGYLSTVGQYLSGNNQLRSTIVTNYELGYDRDLPDLQARSRLTLFHQINEDLAGDTFESLFVGPAPTGNVSVDFQNIGVSRQWGAELALDGQLAGGLTWNLSYRLSAIHDQLNGLAQPSLWRPATETPKHKLVGHLGYSLGDIELDLYCGYQSSIELLTPSFTSLVPITVRDYASLGGRVGWRINDGLEVALSAEDATAGSGQTQTAARAIEPRAFLSITGHF